MTFVTAFIVLGLICVNALYVAAEFSAVSARRSRVRQLAREGNTLASFLLPVLENGLALDRYIAVCQIGITFSSLVLGAYGQAVLAVELRPYFEAWGSLQVLGAQSVAAAVVLVVLTSMQVILGELVPKSFALQHPARTALLTVLPMRWSVTAFAWFTAVLNGSGLLIVRLLGLGHAGHRHIHSPQEIELLIAESRAGGLLDPDEQRRLHRALRLGLRSARQLMVPRTRIRAVAAGTPVVDLVRQLADSPYTRFPVYRDRIDNVIGLLHTKDLMLHCLERSALGPIDECMRPVVTVPETMKADQLLKELRGRRAHQAIVLDEFGGVAGLVTLEDVLVELLEAAPGGLRTAGAQAERLPDGRIRLPGRMRLDEAQVWLGRAWPGRALTVGGHVVSVLGHLPAAGERVTIEGQEVEVERVDGRTVATVLVRPAASRSQSE